MDIGEVSKIINCFECGRKFVEFYSQEVKENCLTMYVNGNSFRGIERITKVNHNTVIRWVRQMEKKFL
ncbi:hypothetical protein [Dapis sp. BLCC M172]|uniref:hypothetical protein n=1 Tax=Dapis sp. BLCC M172 TaxID=2975281 RepID=UPI003CF66966